MNESRITLVLHRDDCPDQEVSVRECPTCSSLVAVDRTGAHERFHAGQRRAS